MFDTEKVLAWTKKSSELNYSLSFFSQISTMKEQDLSRSLVAFTQKDQKLFKIASFFTVFTPTLRPLGVGGHEIYNLCPPFPTNATYKIW